MNHDTKNPKRKDCIIRIGTGEIKIVNKKSQLKSQVTAKRKNFLPIFKPQWKGLKNHYKTPKFSSVVGVVKLQLRPFSCGRLNFISAINVKARLVTNLPFPHLGITIMPNLIKLVYYNSKRKS